MNVFKASTLVSGIFLVFALLSYGGRAHCCTDECAHMRKCCDKIYQHKPDFQESAPSGEQDFRFAVCEVKPNPSKPAVNDSVSGTVYFRQKGEDGMVQIAVHLSGFDVSDPHFYHGFHIHALGAVAGGCEKAGGHYNPFYTLHGSPHNDRSNRHVGDLGNIVESSDGTVFTYFSDNLVNLYGPYSVMGRAVVVHQKRDDLGRGGDAESKKTGNAGARLACCVIAADSGEYWGVN